MGWIVICVTCGKQVTKEDYFKLPESKNGLRKCSCGSSRGWSCGVTKLEKVTR